VLGVGKAGPLGVVVVQAGGLFVLWLNAFICQQQQRECSDESGQGMPCHDEEGAAIAARGRRDDATVIRERINARKDPNPAVRETIATVITIMTSPGSRLIMVGD